MLLDAKQWGTTNAGVFTFPVAFSQAFSAVALKSNDHGGGIPNLIGLSNSSAKIELEWNDNGQHTSNPNRVNVVAIGR